MEKRKQLLLIAVLLVFISLPNVYANLALKPSLPGGEEYLAFCETMPSIIGGMGALSKNLSYPPIAKQARLEGKVYILAFIDDKGNVHDVKVLKGIGGGCDEAAANAVKKCKFNPGKNKGVNVKVKLSLTINFKL